VEVDDSRDFSHIPPFDVDRLASLRQERVYSELGITPRPARRRRAASLFLTFRREPHTCDSFALTYQDRMTSADFETVDALFASFVFGPND
jgi:hypothetical protein